MKPSTFNLFFPSPDLRYRHRRRQRSPPAVAHHASLPRSSNLFVFSLRCPHDTNTFSSEAFLYRCNSSTVLLVPSPSVPSQTTAFAHPLPKPPERAQINHGSSHVLLICCWVLS
ncbi:hypothetical protein CDL15_Pgr017319 [Punica granatum]|uniref:Uncharacterized protein n=1 Tax=Punica granatum TaxID=22663 RepID=A0A218Y3K6_PUNGR|nr:hypothetical protein CDL15_Pgr017319 [Punica granatum]